MGMSNSCLPVKLSRFCSKHRDSTISRLRLEHHQSVLNNAININQVSEDELLLLPGITRSLANNIVQYRHMHNGFKQINEILQVKGITSRTFKCICADLTIDSCPLSHRKELVNLNLASYNDLCLIPGLKSTHVTRIIQRRERQGAFRFVEDLLNIKGINYSILANIRPHVIVDYQQITTCTSYSTDTLALASRLLETLPMDLQTILISSPPSLPFSIETKPKTFRFASWNLQNLTNDKVQNPGVREVICRVILANNFSLIGIQEIGNKESLDVIINELNHPTISLIKDWPNRPRGKWKHTISDIAGRTSEGSEYLGFLYNEAVGIELKQTSSLSFQTYFTRSPYITIFRIYNKFDFVFVNIHFKAKRSDEDENERTKDEAKSLSVLAQAMKDTIEQKYVIIFGGFNIIPTAQEFNALVNCNYSYTIRENTNISLNIPQGTTCADNIWLSTEAKALSTGNSGIIRDNLSSLWIPAGWTWGGLVSDHCPIWTEFNLS